jgi:hypothetical protein|tara:strand:- start:20 stop:169 length:150 start_codon:yes stop_codon:yes gene_type:complete
MMCGKEILQGTLCSEHKSKYFSGEVNAPPPKPPEDEFDPWDYLYPQIYP